MAGVKGRAKILGDQGQYAKVEDMSFPNPHSAKMSDLDWRLRHAPESISRGDQVYMASIISAYREIVLFKTAKDRQHVCSAIKWTGSTAEHKLLSDGSGKV